MYRTCYTSLVAHMIVSHMLTARHKHIECDSGQTFDIIIHKYTPCTFIHMYVHIYANMVHIMVQLCSFELQCTATHGNTLERTATHCNALHRTATHMCERAHALRAATHCNKHICERAHAPRSIHLCVLELQHIEHTATHCNTMQHIATHCDTLQHTATHCNTL